jgi:hypothetical protein
MRARRFYERITTVCDDHTKLSNYHQFWQWGSQFIATHLGPTVTFRLIGILNGSAEWQGKQKDCGPTRIRTPVTSLTGLSWLITLVKSITYSKKSLIALTSCYNKRTDQPEDLMVTSQHLKGIQYNILLCEEYILHSRRFIKQSINGNNPQTAR